MNKIVISLMYMFLFAGFVQAQRTITGIVVQEIDTNKWSAIVIKVGNKKYGVQTGFNASAGDLKDGIKPWVLKTSGNIGTGKTVQVFYTKVDNTFDYDGVNTWLKAIKIVEIKNPKPSETNQTTLKNIHQIDFNNFTYVIPEFGSGERKPNRFRNGKGSDAIITNTAYGDLTGNGQDEAVMIITVSAGGGGNAYFMKGLVFTMKNNRPIVLTEFDAGGKDSGNNVQEIRIKNGLLMLSRDVTLANENPCCPKYQRFFSYRWNGNSLLEMSKSPIQEKP